MHSCCTGILSHTVNVITHESSRVLLWMSVCIAGNISHFGSDPPLAPNTRQILRPRYDRLETEGIRRNVFQPRVFNIDRIWVVYVITTDRGFDTFPCTEFKKNNKQTGKRVYSNPKINKNLMHRLFFCKVSFVDSSNWCNSVELVPSEVEILFNRKEIAVAK